MTSSNESPTLSKNMRRYLARPLEADFYISSMCKFLRISPIISLVTVLQGAPVIPGLENKHPLTEAQKGLVLIEELRCASCHEGVSAKPQAAGPDLREVGSRIQPDFLKKFIQNPAQHDLGTTMPNVFGNLSTAEQETTATALSAYLLSLKSASAKPADLPKVDANEGKKLFHEIGCVACHTPQDDSAQAKALTGHLNLAHVSKKYQPTGLADFLHEPLKVRTDGRMPDMRLSRGEAELLAAFLVGPAQEQPKAETADAATIAAGKKAFAEMNCTACHQIDTTEKSKPLAAPKSKLNLNAGCLSTTPGKAPNYELNDAQRMAIRAALTEVPKQLTSEESIAIRLTQLNCIACHQRDEYGGVKPELDGYFHSTEEALGNHARIPPELTMLGAKLQPDWLNKVLYEGEAIRPYMITRMPQFGSAALDGLPKFFSDTDTLPPFEFAPLADVSKPEMQDGAHRLLGDQGINCIACHNYNGKESPGMKGLDLMTTYQRLQPAWFNQFMRNPAKIRPGIIMPSFWPDGKAVQTEILQCNTEEQIRALWHNFSLGHSARDPSGLRAEDPLLTVTDQTRTYRGRSEVAGYRGIAVGFPGGINYAFNARNGAFSSVWIGKYVSVGWRGQGSGNFNPASPSIQLAQDVAFLTELPETWPLAPIRTKENPVNPDPTYPAQHGYAFQGYTIGEKGIPTFRYLCGEIEIEDTTITVGGDKPTGLRRMLSFKTNKPKTLYFRALAGEIETISESTYSIEKIKIDLGESTVKPNVNLRKNAAGDELILKLDLPAGTSTQTLDYAPIR